ncbi:hypothetical protein [Actinophytocola xanthii]|uniref:hypothetical protein n=1 Tax=Actinophytocola xanthii TaxID=1912961 RepID=UPI001E2E6855|nr:hypothetical protein [Actinophytocola xanthii]
MNPIVAQVLTIAGVLLGAAATFVVTSATERTRWQRAQSVRWDDKRLVGYAEYANAVKHMVRLCRRIAETKGLLSTGQPVDIDSTFAALADAETQRAAQWETVLLLGEPTTIVAARAWSEQVWRLEHILRQDHPEASSFIDAYQETMRRRNRVLRPCPRRPRHHQRPATRAHLAIPSALARRAHPVLTTGPAHPGTSRYAWQRERSPPMGCLRGLEKAP